MCINKSLLYYSEHIALAHHEIFLAVKLNLCSGIFSIEHDIALLENHLLVLSAVSCGNNLAALWLLFCCVRNDNSTNFLFCLCREYQYSVC